MQLVGYDDYTKLDDSAADKKKLSDDIMKKLGSAIAQVGV